MAKAETLERPEVLRFKAMAAPTTADETNRTIELGIASEANPDGFVLRCTKEAVTTAPVVNVLLDHRNETAAIAGRLLSIREERGQLIGVAQFTDAPAAEVGWQLARAGCPTSVRAQFNPDDIQPGRNGGPDVVTKWRLAEVSLVAIGADPLTATRSLNTQPTEDTMTISTEQAPEATVTRAALREAQSLERSISAAGLDDAGADEVRGIAEAQGVAAARAAIIDKMAQREAQAPTRAHVGAESSGGNREQLIERTVARLQGRDDITVNELLRATTGRSGRTDELLRSSQSTSDLAQLVGAAAQRYAQQMYGALEPGSSAIARRRQVADLRDVQLLRISEFPGLEELTEGGELRYGALGETGGSYVIREFAKALRLTRRALLSDDLGLLELAMASGARAAGQLEDQLVRALLEGGAGGLGGICGEDSKALFHSSHNNVASNTGLSIEALTEALALLRGQTVPGASAPLNLRPRHLLVPASHEVPARQLVAAVQPVSVDGVNPFGAGADLALQVHVDPLLSAAYLAVDPSDPAAAIELATGPAALQVDSQPEFETTSLAMRVLADRGAGIRDFRGIARIPLA